MLVTTNGNSRYREMAIASFRPVKDVSESFFWSSILLVVSAITMACCMPLMFMLSFHAGGEAAMVLEATLGSATFAISSLLRLFDERWNGPHLRDRRYNRKLHEAIDAGKIARVPRCIEQAFDDVLMTDDRFEDLAVTPNEVMREHDADVADMFGIAEQVDNGRTDEIKQLANEALTVRARKICEQVLESCTLLEEQMLLVDADVKMRLQTEISLHSSNNKQEGDSQ